MAAHVPPLLSLSCCPYGWAHLTAILPRFRTPDTKEHTAGRPKGTNSVSVKFLITYCQRHRIITSERATALNKQYSSRKWHKGEPVEVVKESARLFPDVVRRMRRDGLDIGMCRSDVMDVVLGRGDARSTLTIV